MTNRYTNVPKSDNKPENVVIIRGGGDLASGTIHRLYRCGYRLLVLECEKPTAIRRMVSFCEAVYDGQSSVEGVLCRKVDSVEECEAVWKAGEIHHKRRCYAKHRSSGYHWRIWKRARAPCSCYRGNPLYLKDCRYRGEGSGPCLDRRYTCQGFSYRSFAWHDQRWIYSAEGDENCRY